MSSKRFHFIFKMISIELYRARIGLFGGSKAKSSSSGKADSKVQESLKEHLTEKEDPNVSVQFTFSRKLVVTMITMLLLTIISQDIIDDRNCRNENRRHIKST